MSSDYLNYELSKELHELGVEFEGVKWKYISNYHWYLVSEKGDVYHRGNKYKRLLKQETTKTGYKRVQLTNSEGRKKFAVHRLVAKAFISNPDNKPQVNHKDGNKSNNCVSNLEWCTGSDNLKHAYHNGLTKNPNCLKPVQQLKNVGAE